MSWSYRIARVSGIDVKIHVTFLLLLAWFAWGGWQDGGGRAAVAAVAFVLLLFLCVLLHEFGHALAARMYGIRTPDITLLPIGGVARLERMPDKPWQEFVVAVAGPAVNVVIALTLWIVLAAKWQLSDLMNLDVVDGNMVAKLMTVNVMLVVFNAIPAFPMDGGRVLRSLLAMKLDYVLATTIAVRVGQVMAALFFVAGALWSPMLMFIAVFVFMGAQQELAYARFRSDVMQRRVSDIMRADFAGIPAEMSCGQAWELARRSGQQIFPVIDSQLRARGIVTHEALARAGGSMGTVGDLASDIPRISPAMPVGMFVQQFGPGAVAVVENSAGQMVGLVHFPQG